MITTLREGKAKFSALVEMASKGEEVIITVHGKPKARLCPISIDKRAQRAAWVRELKEARAKYSIGVHDSADILDDIRSDRV